MLLLRDKYRILIIGVGNEYRSDDGVGLAIARKIQEKRLSGIAVKEETGEGATLMEEWKGADRVILVDAVFSGATPGTVYRFDVHAQPISVGADGRSLFHSTHAFGIAEAVELARTLHQLPRCLIIYGIEGKTFEAGVGLSPEVERAVGEVIERVVQEVQYRKAGNSQ